MKPRRHIAIVIAHLFAQLVKYIGRRTTVGKGVQMHFYASLRQCLHPIEHVDNPAIIGRPRDIERNEMKVHRQKRLNDVDRKAVVSKKDIIGKHCTGLGRQSHFVAHVSDKGLLGTDLPDDLQGLG